MQYFVFTYYKYSQDFEVLYCGYFGLAVYFGIRYYVLWIPPVLPSSGLFTAGTAKVLAVFRPWVLRVLAGLNCDLFSRHALSFGSSFLWRSKKTIMNVVNDPKRRASPRSNCSDQ